MEENTSAQNTQSTAAAPTGALTACETERFNNYNLKAYEEDVREYGLEEIWRKILNYALNVNCGGFLNVDAFAELYETGLALNDKEQKKSSGKYYTPNDVALIMSKWLSGLNGENVCDAGCGTGNLILKYLEVIGETEAKNLIKARRLFLYDTDRTALNICKASILIKYGKDLNDCINAVCGDFLDKNLKLPANCKVIANPPYSRITEIPENRSATEVAKESMELYAMFMEKIITQSAASVIITPYSFIGGVKFYSLRKLMNAYNGFIVAFDNVPGNIFYGKKHGTFNTNTANSVRAAITVTENKDGEHGFKVSPLIRFKNTERKQLLDTRVLEGFIYDRYQTVSQSNRMYYKCDTRLGHIWEVWRENSDARLNDYVSKDGEYVLSVPNAFRYYTTAFNGLMNRSGQITLKFADRDVFNYLFCMINSSFAYWYWRLYDGGFTYQKSLLLSLPTFFGRLSRADKMFFAETAQEMIADANKYVKKKNNVGVQENIKYPKPFRDKINRRFLSVLGLDENENIFDIVHSNMALEINVE